MAGSSRFSNSTVSPETLVQLILMALDSHRDVAPIIQWTHPGVAQGVFDIPWAVGEAGQVFDLSVMGARFGFAHVRFATLTHAPPDLLDPGLMNTFDLEGVDRNELIAPDHIFGASSSSRCRVIVTITYDLAGFQKEDADDGARSELYSTILSIASHAARSLSRKAAIPMSYRPGPLTRADLCGPGLIRLHRSSDGGQKFFKLPNSPRLGCLDLPSALMPATDLGPIDVTGWGAEQERDQVWLDRMMLHEARGEWEEAMVSLEAAAESLMAKFLDYLLVDHGWTRSHFSDFDRSNANLILPKLFLSLRPHIKGSGNLWDEMDRRIRHLYETRNLTIHLARNVTEQEYVDERVSFGLVTEFITSRLQDVDVVRSHPRTAATFAADVLAELSSDPQQLFERLAPRSRIADLRDSNDPPRAGVPQATSGSRFNECWAPGKAPKLRDLIDNPK